MSQPAPTAFSSPFAHLVHDMETLELLTTVTNSIRYQYYRQTSSLCIDLQWEGATCYRKLLPMRTISILRGLHIFYVTLLITRIGPVCHVEHSDGKT